MIGKRIGMRGSPIGVVGASGHLGGLIAQTASEAGHEVRAISGRAAGAGSADDMLAGLAGVIIAAPLSLNAYHRRALDAGCHVVDVGIVEQTIREALSLDNLAKDRDRSLVVMAGLAPGLSGLLGSEMARRHPSAAWIDVVLVQNADGTAGERGVRDMLDMLTDPERSPIMRLNGVALPALGRSGYTVFGLPSPERTLMGSDGTGPGSVGRDGSGPVIRYHTAFDRPAMNRTIRALRGVRRHAPRGYAFVRDRVAAAKARRPEPESETITLGATATASGAVGATLGYERIELSSDYGTTAKIAVTLMGMATAGDLASGAGHPAAFTDWATVNGRVFA